MDQERQSVSGIEILIREARPHEADRLQALVTAAYREFQPLFPEKVWCAWMDNIRETIHSGTGILSVAEQGEVIHGVVKFYPDASQSAMGRWPAGASSRHKPSRL